MAQRKYTRKEIETRNGRDDAVFVINNVVYDVTPFLDEHPGGHEVLLEKAGGDATENFADVGHSADAKELMKKYAVGEVADEDRVEVRYREPTFEPRQEQGSSAWRVWLPPVLLGVIATVLYTYVFG